MLCLTIDNLFILIKPSYIVNIFPDLEEIEILKLEEPKMNFSGEVVRGDKESQIFADKIFEISKQFDLRTPQYDLTTEVLEQKKLITNLDETICNHPAHRFGDSKKLKRFRKRIIEIEQELSLIHI